MENSPDKAAAPVPDATAAAYARVLQGFHQGKKPQEYEKVWQEMQTRKSGDEEDESMDKSMDKLINDDSSEEESRHVDGSTVQNSANQSSALTGLSEGDDDSEEDFPQMAVQNDDEDGSYFVQPDSRQYCPGFSVQYAEYTEPMVYTDASVFHQNLTAAHKACHERMMKCFEECTQGNRVRRQKKRKAFQVILDRKCIGLGCVVSCHPPLLTLSAPSAYQPA